MCLCINKYSIVQYQKEVSPQDDSLNFMNRHLRTHYSDVASKVNIHICDTICSIAQLNARNKF